MKLPHYVVILIACACALAPIFLNELPARYAGIAPAILAIVAALKVQALRQDEEAKP